MKPALQWKLLPNEGGYLWRGSLTMAQGSVPTSDTSCLIILGIILPFLFFATLNSAEMRFRHDRRGPVSSGTWPKTGKEMHDLNSNQAISIFQYEC